MNYEIDIEDLPIYSDYGMCITGTSLCWLIGEDGEVYIGDLEKK